MVRHLATKGLLDAFSRSTYVWWEDCSRSYESLASLAGYRAKNKSTRKPMYTLNSSAAFHR